MPEQARGDSSPRAYCVMGRGLLADFVFEDLIPTDRCDPSLRLFAVDDLPPPGAPVRALFRPASDEPWLRVFDGEAGLQWWIDGVGRFLVDPAGIHVRYRLVPGARRAEAEHALLGPVLGVALRLQGATLLHAGAVVIGGRAMAFSGPAGVGKSTLAASFAREGAALLSDDILPVELPIQVDGETAGDRARAIPYVPRLKMWGDSLAAFGDDERGYPAVLSWAEKRRVPVEGGWGAVATGAAPLDALYLLAPHARAGTRVEIARVDAGDALLALVGAMYMADLDTPALARGGLEAAARLAPLVDVRRVSYVRSYEGLAAVRRAVCEDVASRAGAP